MPIIIYIFDLTHNIQLGYNYNYVIFTPYGKITHVKCKVMDIYFSHHILNNIKIYLIGGYIRHQILLISYMPYYNVICYIM